jgi:hypothetical protein
MKTNEEYWKQRCLLAESMLEEKIDYSHLGSLTTPIISPFEKYNWIYIEFLNLLRDNRLYHFYFIENSQGSIRVFDKEDKTIFNIGASSKTRVYELALKQLKTYLNEKK